MPSTAKYHPVRSTLATGNNGHGRKFAYPVVGQRDNRRRTPRIETVVQFVVASDYICAEDNQVRFCARFAKMRLDVSWLFTAQKMPPSHNEQRPMMLSQHFFLDHLSEPLIAMAKVWRCMA